MGLLVYLEDKEQGGEQYKSKNRPMLLAMPIWQVAMWVNHKGQVLSERNVIIYMLFPGIMEMDHEVGSW